MIELKPSSIVIHDYKTNTWLERMLSVWDGVYFKVTWSAMMKSKDEKDLIIPRGYNLEDLTKTLRDNNILDNTDKVIKSRDVNFKCLFPPKNLRQQNAIRFLEGSTNYYAYTNGRRQKMISLKTGDGKTYIASAFAANFSKATMIIVNNNIAIQQWKEKELMKLTDLKEEDIAIISGSSSIKKLLKEKPKHKVYIASHRTLSSYGKEDPWKITEIFKHLGIGLKIYDEAHLEWKNIFLVDSVTDISMTVYLTATPSRSNREEDKVYDNMFNDVVVYGLESKYKQDENYHKIVYVDYNSNPSASNLAKIAKVSKYGFNVNAWCDYIIDNKFDSFIENLQELIDMSYKNNKTPKIAVVVHTLGMVEKVKESLKSIYTDKTFGDFTSNTDKKVRDEELMRDIIVTTEKSFGQLVNVMDLAIMINTVPISSKTLIEQLLGRLRYVEGKQCVFFDMTDIGFEQCKNQKRLRKQILDLKAKSTFQLSLPLK